MNNFDDQAQRGSTSNRSGGRSSQVVVGATAASPQRGATALDDEGHRRRGGWWWLVPLLVALVLLAILAGAFGWFDNNSPKHIATTGVHSGVTSSTGKPAVLPTATGPGATVPASTGDTGSAGAGANGLVGGGGISPAAAAGALVSTGSVGDVLFPEAGAALDTDAQAVVAEAVKEVRQEHATEVTVTGYTDGIGDPTSNQQLSILRANAVIAALKAQLGTSVTFNSAAYGQSEPVSTNSTAAGRQLNRRVVIVAGK